jgi:hypothetical protein
MSDLFDFEVDALMGRPAVVVEHDQRIALEAERAHFTWAMSAASRRPRRDVIWRAFMAARIGGKSASDYPAFRNSWIAAFRAGVTNESRALNGLPEIDPEAFFVKEAA